MRPTRFQPEHMARAQNRAAFAIWLSSCTDEALTRANPVSLANSYGVDVVDVNSAIMGQRASRRLANG
jgi:hypothetical protein